MNQNSNEHSPINTILNKYSKHTHHISFFPNTNKELKHVPTHKGKEYNKNTKTHLKEHHKRHSFSKMCTAFLILQGLSEARMDPNKWEALWNKGVRHMLFAIKLYRNQCDAGRFFLHEHPASASSWKLPEMMA